MLIHDDVDDESTLDEEEALDERDDEEVDELQKVTHPLEDSILLHVLPCSMEGVWHCMLSS